MPCSEADFPDTAVQCNTVLESLSHANLIEQLVHAFQAADQVHRSTYHIAALQLQLQP